MGIGITVDLHDFIIIFNIGLIIRVIVEKCLCDQLIEWCKYHKMTFQMLSVSLLFIIFYLTITVIYLAHIQGVPKLIP
jgi:hypothetical protein